MIDLALCSNVVHGLEHDKINLFRIATLKLGLLDWIWHVQSGQASFLSSPSFMSDGSPAAYLLWAILSCLVCQSQKLYSLLLNSYKFLVFLVLHLWAFDRFDCVRWKSGRQPGAFKRVMTCVFLF